MYLIRPLDDHWTLAPVPGTLPPSAGPLVDAGWPVAALVPGCVHTDLLAAGLIEDPYVDDNELRLSWIGRTDWSYETRFTWSDDGSDRVDLVCAGLDTVATVTLNGVEVARTANMFRSYRFDVGRLLRAGENRLAIRFDSAYRYAESVRDAVGERPNGSAEPFQYIRKMACNFGWDWGPTLVTAGIWRPIGLHAWSTARIGQVRPLVTVARGQGRVEAHVTLDRADDRPLTVTAELAGVRAEVPVPAGQTEVTVRLAIPDPALWWPRGYGDQARYRLTIGLRDGASTLDTWRRRVGFRSIRLDTSADEHGSRYTLVVNDVPVFVRGANWIPDDTFPHRVDRARYAARLAQAAAGGMNYLRVWGGGRYESEDFYDLADAHGLLVGQDFLFACAPYPEEEPLASEVAAEAAEHVVRLASHPSLVTWTGNNENIWGWYRSAWQQTLGGRTWGLGYYLDLLPSIVSELDPTRPYWPGSPYSGAFEIDPNDPSRGNMHIWDVWNTDDYTHYRSYRPRFVAEFGYQAPPAYATLRRAVTEPELTPDSPLVQHHQKQICGDEKLLRNLAGHLPTPASFDDWHYTTQLNQARAVAFGVEHFRSLRPVCAGAIVWQLNDCWPVISWSAVDGDGRRKPLWYALRRAYADRLLTIQPRDGGLALVAVNDARAPWQTHLDVARRTLTGDLLAKTCIDLQVPPGEARTVPLPTDLATPTDPTAELLIAGTGPDRALHFFVEDIEIAHPVPAYDASAEPANGGYRVTITARSFLRDLVLYPDRLDPAAEVDDALFTLLPGESATLLVHCSQSIDPASLTAPPVLRCVGQLLADQIDGGGPVDELELAADEIAGDAPGEGT